jgi:hypothetical protein
MRVYMDGSEASNGLGGRWSIRNRVLIADVMSDVAADLIHLIKGWRKKSCASSTVRNNLEGALGSARLLSAQQANGVNG